MRIAGSRWAVITPTLDIHKEDFGGANVVPLLRHSQFPRGGRPFFAFAPLGDERLVELRVQAAALATVLGADAPALGAAAENLWAASYTHLTLPTKRTVEVAAAEALVSARLHAHLSHATRTST